MPAPSASKCLYPQSLLGTGNTDALRLNVYFPCPLLCIEALTRTRFGINRVSVPDGLQTGSVQLSNEQESSKEPKSDTRQISNLMRVPLSIPGGFRRQAGSLENPWGKFSNLKEAPAKSPRTFHWRFYRKRFIYPAGRYRTLRNRFSQPWRSRWQQMDAG